MLIGFALLAAAAPPSLDWLEGRWCTDAGARQICETWQAMDRGGVMRGTTETTGAKGRSIERMTITNVRGKLIFHAEPEGQTPADFVAHGTEGRSVAFLNSGHDYPQRIRYWREGKLLMAEIAMADGGKPTRWTYRRKK